VIIPVFNGGAVFQNCLKGLFQSDFRDFEVIVVDDGSADNSSQVAEKFGCHVIMLKENLGPARARNIGARQAEGDILVFMDSDVLFGPETLGRIIQALEKGWDGCVGIYTPIPGYKNFSSLYKNIFIWHQHGISNGKVDWFWGACGGIRKDVFAEAGGFDESFRCNTVEDIDLGYRITRRAHKIFLEKQACVQHFHYFTLGNLLLNDLRKSCDWTRLNLTRSRSSGMKHPSVQLKQRGIGIIGSLAFAGTLILSIFEPFLLFAAIFALLISWGIERGFFASLLRHGGFGFFVKALFFKPVDDWVVSIGAFVGAVNFMFKRRFL
jgi:glycosyltransferase involved in cell wall biosynthesis